MPEYLTPGVYVEEIERGPRPIEGVPTSTAAFLGETERGQIRPRLVTSYNDYKRWFGETAGLTDRYMPYASNGFFENGGKRLYVCRIVGEGATAASADFGGYAATAVGAGVWGNRVWVKIEDSSTTSPDPANPGQSIPVGFRMKLAYWTEPIAAPFDPFLPQNRRTEPRPALAEDFDDLTIDRLSPDYFEKRLFENSALADFVRTTAGPDVLPTNGEALLANGADDPNPILSDDYVGDRAGQRADLQGLRALEQDRYRDVALVHAPYYAPDADNVSRQVIDHCERERFRFAVVDCPRNVGNAASLDPRTTLANTQYGAFYYPWFYVADPATGARALVPPGGYALGVYARSDTERGVWKAPANERVRGVVDLEFDIDNAVQAQLNPRGVNATRLFPGRGIRIWGARTLSSNTLWKYVSVRRLFIFLERSIYEGTQWVVFEPNDPRLWARVRDTIRLFLRAQWRAGALFGETEDQAFFITCDRTTMTQNEILNGQLICEIGIAPVRPAEFVIFRIFQQTAEAQS